MLVKVLDAYDRVADMNYNNEIFEISNIYIIWVTCCMHVQKNVILEKNNDVIFIFLLSSNYLYEEYIIHYFYVIRYTSTLHLSFTSNM